LAVGVPVLSFGLLIALGPHSIQKVMDKRDFDGKIHTHSTNSTKLTRLISSSIRVVFFQQGDQEV